MQKKNSIFANLQFFCRLKKNSTRAFQWCIICHFWTLNIGFRGGGVKLTPPQRILVFKYPSRDRVKVTHKRWDVKHELQLIEFNYLYRNINDKIYTTLRPQSYPSFYFTQYDRSKFIWLHIRSLKQFCLKFISTMVMNDTRSVCLKLRFRF